MKKLVFLLAPIVLMGADNPDRVVKEVRHELVMLPYYGIFDDLAYRVDGGKVTLFGAVTQPTLKSDAEKAVKRVEGVTSVDNQIEVLPLSPNDDRIRRDIYRAIFSKPGLEKYQMGAVPPVHILVKNGNVTLVGPVISEVDKTQMGLAANGVSGVFKVTNNIRIEK